MKRLTQILVIVFAAGVGYGAHYTKHLVDEMDRPVVVPQTRMAELTLSSCPNGTGDDAVTLSLIEKIFDNPATPASDFDVKRPTKNGGCAFEYLMAGDSYIQGTGVVNAEGANITEVKFFNRLDTRLIKSSDPSFSVFFFYGQSETYIFETWTNRLYVLNGGHLRKLGGGSTERRPVAP